MQEKYKLEDFKKLKGFKSSTGKNNIAFYNKNNLIKIDTNNIKYWNILNNKKLGGFNKQIMQFTLEGDFEDYINNVFYATNYNSAIIIPYLKNYVPLNDFDFSKISDEDIFKLFKQIFLNNFLAVNEGFVHSDYTVSNIMINNKLNPIIIDLENGILEDYNKNYLTAQNSKYLFKSLDKINKVIYCDKLTLLNIFINVLGNRKLDKDSHIIKTNSINKTINKTNLPIELKEKYKNILLKKDILLADDFLIDDINSLLNYNTYKL